MPGTFAASQFRQIVNLSYVVTQGSICPVEERLIQV